MRTRLSLALVVSGTSPRRNNVKKRECPSARNKPSMRRTSRGDNESFTPVSSQILSKADLSSSLRSICLVRSMRVFATTQYALFTSCCSSCSSTGGAPSGALSFALSPPRLPAVLSALRACDS